MRSLDRPLSSFQKRARASGDSSSSSSVWTFFSSSKWVASCGVSLAKRGARHGDDLLDLREPGACTSWNLGLEALEDEGDAVDKEDEEEGAEVEGDKHLKKAGDADAVGS